MKFIASMVFLVVLAGFFHFMFIFVDYGFNDPGSGGFSIAYNVINRTLSPAYQGWLYNHSVMYKQFFGLGRVLVFGLIIVVVVIHVVAVRKEQEV